jgi:hypothetical protein
MDEVGETAKVGKPGELEGDEEAIVVSTIHIARFVG